MLARMALRKLSRMLARMALRKLSRMLARMALRMRLLFLLIFF
jgi:hypothetical protein